MANSMLESHWTLLLDRIKSGLCTPFLGAGVSSPPLPLGWEVARDWARLHRYPLEDRFDLARVAQFMGVTGDPMYPKEEILRRIQSVKAPDFDDPDEPHGVLARLPFPIYITTNYDNFLVDALKHAKRQARQELCRWNSLLADEPSVFDETFELDPNKPVVFHMHGHIGNLDSLVLTEDDYFDFLVNISRDETLIPLRIRRVLTQTTLLFIGYRIADWDFRVLHRSLVSTLEKALGRIHVSVQLTPGPDTASKKQRDPIESYLNQYFDKLHIRLYWGNAREFSHELQDRWDKRHGR